MSARAEAAGPRAHGGREAAARRSPTAAQLVVALTLVGAALRFATLNVQSLWLDESATILLVHRSFGGMLSHLSSNESAPPLYYVLAWLWTHVFGTGAVGFRSLSALAGTATIPVLYACGREISDRVGVWAAALATFSPAMYYYSQEARAYGLLVLFGAVAFLCWQRALRLRTGRSLAWWGAASALALLTHYFALFLFVPEALILWRRLGRRMALPPIAAVCVVGAALVPLAASQRSDGKAKWIEEASLTTRFGETVKQFLVGLYGPLEIETAAISGLLVLAALVVLVRRGGREEHARGRDAAVVAVTGVLLPLVFALIHAIDVFDGRNVIAAWGPYALVLAAGVGVARAGRAGPAIGGGLCAVGIGVIVATNLLPGYQRDDWRGVAQSLPAPLTPRAIVGERYAGSPLSLYVHQRLSGVTGGQVTVREIDFATLRVRRTKGSPTPPYVPPAGPPGFRLAGVKRTEAYAVTRYVSPRARAVAVGELLRLGGVEGGEALVTR